MAQPNTNKTQAYLAGTGLLATAAFATTFTLAAPVVALPLFAVAAAPAVLSPNRKQIFGRLYNETKSFLLDLGSHLEADIKFGAKKAEGLINKAQGWYKARKEAKAAKKAAATSAKEEAAVAVSAPAEESKFDASATTTPGFNAAAPRAETAPAVAAPAPAPVAAPAATPAAPKPSGL